MAGTGGLLYASLQVAQAQFLPFGKTGNTPISPIANSQTVFSTVRILHSTYLESPSVEGAFLWSATLGYNQKIDTSKTDFFLHAFNIAIFVEKHKHFFSIIIKNPTTWTRFYDHIGHPRWGY